jgi:predicted lipase
MATHAAVEIHAIYGSNINIIHYTFGSPRVGNNKFSQFFSTIIGNSFRVVHYRDIVPHLPPKDLGFHHISREVFYAEDNSSYTVCDSTGED